MTVREFRSQPELVSKLRNLFEAPELKLWIETFSEDENPMNKVAPPDVTPHGAYILLGEQTGWRQCLLGFLNGAVPLEQPRKEEEMTYGAASSETQE